MQLEKASLDFVLQIRRNNDLTTLLSPVAFVILLVAWFVETYPVFFHLGCQLFDRDRAVCVVIHFFEEKLDLLLEDFWVDVLDELRKLLVVELGVILEAQTIKQSVQIDVFGVDFESEIPHDSF